MPLQPSAEKALSKNEKIAIIIGFFLIVCVLAFTSIRSLTGKKSAENNTAGNGGASQTAVDYDTISSNDLRQLVQQNKGAVLVDIRSFDDFITQHVIDSINIPADEISNTSKIKPSDAIFIIGANSNDSAVSTAVTSLKSKNFTNIKVLAGGLAAWSANGGSTVSFGDPTLFVDQAKVFYADVQKAHDLIKNDPSTVILDVRDPSDFSQGHVPNAINIPLMDLERRRNEIPAFKKILIFGVTDVAEFQAGVQLYDLVQITPYVVKGAMQGWQDAKFEIVK